MLKEMTNEEMMKVDGGGYYGTERSYSDRNTSGPEATGEDYAKAGGAMAGAAAAVITAGSAPAIAQGAAAIVGAANGYQIGDYFHDEVD